MNKKSIAALAASFMALGVGSAQALPNLIYWHRASPNVYDCQGTGKVVICKEMTTQPPHYGILIDHSVTDVFFGKHPIFSCQNRNYPESCVDFR